MDEHDSQHFIFNPTHDSQIFNFQHDIFAEWEMIRCCGRLHSANLQGTWLKVCLEIYEFAHTDTDFKREPAYSRLSNTFLRRNWLEMTWIKDSK